VVVVVTSSITPILFARSPTRTVPVHSELFQFRPEVRPEVRGNVREEV
jgi:hypothetical protein